ncbi:hypothetical protein DCE93_01260 [Agromyces badenianii]|uniref:Uncharacterized protein n=1 Tax=Agromyces badenianii TaxID=2080742 RepID=A0A2S0WSZ2_9MICO|nr:hypothetical protein [Agromyces badenianii]AWB94466.1 hypothetical protein DCE93_01260 [Agromyces badenianii]
MRATLSRQRVKKTLDDLVAIGLATRDTDRSVYWLNDSHVLTAPLLEALDARPNAFTRIKALASETVGPYTTVAVYGSGDEEGLGVLIITGAGDEGSSTELAEILARVLPRMLSGTSRVEVIQPTELADRIKQRNPTALNNWWRSVTVFGPNLADTMITIYRSTIPPAPQTTDTHRTGE